MEFDDETRELLGLDDIEDILGQIDEEAEMDVKEMEKEAQAIKEGADPTDIRDPDEVIAEMGEEVDGDVAGAESDESREFESETN